MANPIVNLLCGIWSCIRGSLRIILFFACLLLALAQAKGMLDLFADDSIVNWLNQNLLDNNNDFFTLIGGLVILFALLLGAYGAFFNHQLSLKIFAILIAACAIVSTVALTSTIAGGGLDRADMRLMSIMKNNSMKYDWDNLRPVNNKPTYAWDMLQSMVCCGLDGPEDWDKFRPRRINDDLYPKSCCAEYRRNIDDNLCPKEFIYKQGCKDRLQAMEVIFLVLSGLIVALHFLLSFIAYILLIPSGSDSSSVSSSHRSVLATTQDYQRFDGSVYVRQPAVAPSYQHQQDYPATKGSAPAMYPNARDIEKDASSPPPSYY